MRFSATDALPATTAAKLAAWRGPFSSCFVPCKPLRSTRTNRPEKDLGFKKRQNRSA
jgi:hypothetical protein